MKRISRIVVTGAVAAGWISLGAIADIEGSAHDFSSAAWSGGEICKPCHTPHFADTDIGFLWAHEMSIQQYTLYDGSTSSPGGVDELDQFSRMCLSCHDGTVALNDFHNSTGPPEFIPADKNVAAGGDLSDDHPIGITAEYPTTGNSQLNAPTETPSGFWGFGGTFFPEVPLFEFNSEQVVSCSTCHTPHAITGIDALLRKDNAGSALCLTCHIK
ncbi:MAG: cytochrome c3 family protein [Planctomycetota bacterium]|jgi:predicted CXXCH cytochrome family protein